VFHQQLSIDPLYSERVNGPTQGMPWSDSAAWAPVIPIPSVVIAANAITARAAGLAPEAFLVPTISACPLTGAIKQQSVPAKLWAMMREFASHRRGGSSHGPHGPFALAGPEHGCLDLRIEWSHADLQQSRRVQARFLGFSNDTGVQLCDSGRGWGLADQSDCIE